MSTETINPFEMAVSQIDAVCDRPNVEWGQNIESFFWDEEEIDSKLERIMTNAFAEVLEISKAEKTDMRNAAYILAIRRLVSAMSIRGIYP